jgi:hypothetical protein
MKDWTSVPIGLPMRQNKNCLAVTWLPIESIGEKDGPEKWQFCWSKKKTGKMCKGVLGRKPMCERSELQLRGGGWGSRQNSTQWHNIKSVGLPPRKISSFLQSFKDDLELKTPGVNSIPWECSQVCTGQTGYLIDTRLKEHQRHTRLEFQTNWLWQSTVSTWGTTSSYTTLPSYPPNLDTWITSSGGDWDSSIPTVWTWRMASVWASHRNLSSAPWKIIGSLHHVTLDLGCLWALGGSCTLPLSEHKRPVQALTSLHPDIPASGHYFCSLIPNHITMTHSLHTSVPCPTHPCTLPLSFSWTSKTAPFQILPKLLFLSPTGSLSGHVRAKRFHPVPLESQWELRSTFPFPSSFLYNLKFQVDSCSACHLLTCWYLDCAYSLTPEDGGDILLWNIDWLSLDHIVLDPRR